MSRKTILAALVLAMFGMTACDDEETTGPGNTQDEIVGTWVSAGADVAPGLAGAPFNTDSIIATFNDDNTYVVDSYSGTTVVNFTGTYQIGPQAEGQIRAITLNQSTPTSLTSEGIFQVSGSGATMQYEVIQTSPALQGFTAPTVAGGFGSTAFNGTPLGATWIQNYDRRN